MIKVKQIKSGLVLPIRHSVLREGKPFETAYFEGDQLKNTIHIGAYINDKLVGVVSLFFRKNQDLNHNNQYQLRGMAVLPKYRGKGVGQSLIKYMTETLHKKANLIWCNARSGALDFYKKEGFKIKGEPFDIPGIGIHYKMYKEL